jgi:GntR family transcriptional regulator/MocR family aminotransferase
MVARWEFAIALDRTKGTALFRQIATAISNDIRRGRLRPGDRLPGTRTLARSLGVQRLTVVSAFDELAAEGWIVTHAARGAFVSPAIPDIPRPRRFAASAVPRSGVADRLGVDLRRGPLLEIPYAVPPGALFFAPNRPDVRLAPGDLIGRAYRRAIRSSGQILLSYGRPQGHERLRVAVADMLSATRGLATKAEDVCITRGSQMGMALLARALVAPGDVVAVEELSHRPGVEVFRIQGASVVPIPLDEQGIRIEPLERLGLWP